MKTDKKLKNSVDSVRDPGFFNRGVPRQKSRLASRMDYIAKNVHHLGLYDPAGNLAFLAGFGLENLSNGVG